jgi:hypothetical protein
VKASYKKIKADDPWVLQRLCNGCGPQNLPWLRPYLPQGPLRGPGDEHDFWYIVGGGFFARRRADLIFGFKCVVAALMNLLVALVYVPLAVIYFIAVRVGGWGSFHYTKTPLSHEEVIELAKYGRKQS